MLHSRPDFSVNELQILKLIGIDWLWNLLRITRGCIVNIWLIEMNSIVVESRIDCEIKSNCADRLKYETNEQSKNSMELFIWLVKYSSMSRKMPTFLLPYQCYSSLKWKKFMQSWTNLRWWEFRLTYRFGYFRQFSCHGMVQFGAAIKPIDRLPTALVSLGLLRLMYCSNCPPPVYDLVPFKLPPYTHTHTHTARIGQSILNSKKATVFNCEWLIKEIAKRRRIPFLKYIV